MSKVSNLSWSEEERLILLIEEANEVIQAAAKILRHGYYLGHPEKSGSSNRNDLEHELGDLQFAINLMIHKEDISSDSIDYFSKLAIKNKGKYLHHNDIPQKFIDYAESES